MANEPLSEHCSLLSKPGGPPRPADRPADCPKDAAYIKPVGAGTSTLPGNAPFPIVFEGGDGDDKVTLVGQSKAGVMVFGGKGNDSLLVEDRWTWLVHELTPPGALSLALVIAILLGLITLRALRLGE
ncbi:hypothetical protein [Novosphingobium clariflavum]|uniref:Uncharacterized protein n=1 Tax=Novosphingobium clariflavum TaxID=2029884 RepID=A0ABV6SE50_9SPHN|nr:hypothetical protein [Novosphingobium clariflavum]